MFSTVSSINLICSFPRFSAAAIFFVLPPVPAVFRISFSSLVNPQKSFSSRVPILFCNVDQSEPFVFTTVRHRVSPRRFCLNVGSMTQPSAGWLAFRPFLKDAFPTYRWAQPMLVRHESQRFFPLSLVDYFSFFYSLEPFFPRLRLPRKNLSRVFLLNFVYQSFVPHFNPPRLLELFS